MSCKIPEFQKLIQMIDTIREDYVAQCEKDGEKPNPKRLALFNTLNLVKVYLLAVQKGKYPLSIEDAQSVMLAGYLYCLETIREEYKLTNPEYKKGYLYNSGSRLYSLLLKYLNINSTNSISEIESLIHLSKLYNFLKDHKTMLASGFGNLNLNELRENIKKVIKTTFAKNHHLVENAIKAIPAEMALDSSMRNIQTRYLDLSNSNNTERKFHAKLIRILSDVLPAQEEEINQKHFLNRRQRIKMGFILYLAQEIWLSYFIRSPKGNSDLYDLMLASLNISAITDIDEYTRVACLTAFETFISDHQCITALELAMGRYYLDPEIHHIRKRLTRQIDAIHPLYPTHTSPSTVAISCAAVGGIISAFIGNGLGSTFGFALSQIDDMAKLKLKATKVTDYTMTVIFGKAGSYLGYYAANMIVDSSMQYAFAKVFQALGALIGASTGGLIGLVFYDFSYKTLCNLCSLYQVLHQQLSPTLAKDLDPAIIECLLTLPKNVFTQEQKHHLCSVTDHGLFQANHPRDPMLLPKLDASDIHVSILGNSGQ